MARVDALHLLLVDGVGHLILPRLALLPILDNPTDRLDNRAD